MHEIICLYTHTEWRSHCEEHRLLLVLFLNHVISTAVVFDGYVFD